MAAVLAERGWGCNKYLAEPSESRRRVEPAIKRESTRFAGNLESLSGPLQQLHVVYARDSNSRFKLACLENPQVESGLPG